MHWTGWIVVALAALTGGWMTFDGIRALVTGDYVTPSSGEYAGRLGPWTKLVQAIGIEPRSTLMKSIFIFYGLATLLMAVCFAVGLPWAWWGLLATAVLGLWYVPIGTLTNLVMLALLLLPPLRPIF